MDGEGAAWSVQVLQGFSVRPGHDPLFRVRSSSSSAALPHPHPVQVALRFGGAARRQRDAAALEGGDEENQSVRATKC